MEYCHFSWEEARGLPIELRKWFIERKRTENERIKREREKQRKEAPAPKRPPTRRR